MINMILEDKVITFLKNMIGEKIESIEIGESEREFNRSYGKLRVNFNKGKIDIFNIEKPVNFMGEKDEMSGFECKINSVEKFKPYLDESVEKICINKKITKIFIIQDKIHVNGDIAIFDEAIVFEGERTLMIARDWQYSESIGFYNHSNYNLINPIDEVIENWNNFGEYDVKVDRIIKILK